MMNWSDKHSVRADRWYAPLAVFLLIYPVLTVLKQGSASALLIAAGVLSLGAGVAVRRALSGPATPEGADRLVRLTGWALCMPLAAVILSEAWHGHLRWNAFDAPARFLAAVPLFLLLRRAPLRALRWADGSFAAGALAALGVGLWAARDWGEGRMGSAFLNPIHFGDIALILGVLSALSINWWRKDPLAVRLLKVGGLLAGLVASLLTGSRGGWVALPFILLLVAVARGRDKPARWRVLVPAVAVLGVAVLYAVSGTIHERIHMVWVDLAQYAQGQKDTSIGIRLQIYQAALMLIPKHPIFGLGPGGFADSLQALVDAGRMSATAAQLGRGEAHNQLLAYTANFGLVGGLSIVAIHLVPGLLCWRCLKAAAAPMRRAALMGAVFALAFFVFGLTVEIFTLKMTASFYAAVIASLAGIASHTGPASEAGTSSLTER